jgi:hypothetical protein
MIGVSWVRWYDCTGLFQIIGVIVPQNRGYRAGKSWLSCQCDFKKGYSSKGYIKFLVLNNINNIN